MKPGPGTLSPATVAAAESGAGRIARRPRLALEISVALCIKALLLFALYLAWFADPPRARLTERGVAAAVVGPAVAPSGKETRPDAP
jgi:hypothetical protein